MVIDGAQSRTLWSSPTPVICALYHCVWWGGGWRMAKYSLCPYTRPF